MLHDYRPQWPSDEVDQNEELFLLELIYEAKYRDDGTQEAFG